MRVISKIFLFILITFAAQICVAQVVPPSATDTLRTIEIIRARSQRQITINDTTVLQSLAGDASVSQGGTKLYGDSIVLNQLTGIAEVFGDVHINDGDTMHTYAQYMKYIGNQRIAYLQRSVKLTDGKAVLTTEDLVYDIATGIANYKNGGKVVNDKTVLTSQDGTYYSDTRDAVFRNNVHLVDPKYNMWADSLRYNTVFKTAYFISPTHIISEDGVIDTKSGSYNLETGDAIFDSQSSFKDSTRNISGQKLAYESKTGIIQVEGNAKFVDSVNKVIVLAGQQLIDKKKNTFLATRKPVMILYKDNDSTYIAADTLFSGLRQNDSITNKKAVDTLSAKSSIENKKNEVAANDSLNFATKLEQVINQIPVKDSSKKDLPVLKDTIKRDSSLILVDSAKKIPADSLSKDSILQNKKDSISLVRQNNTADTLKQATAVDLNKVSKDSIRYFLGFHHVRIYNDSAQAVSDSLYYSTEDSTFKLFGNPVFWNDQTQVKGDTMHLYTEDQKPKRLHVFFNAIAINRTKEGFFNQMGGRTINGYFKDGSIDYIRVKGSPAESIFYPQDDDSAYVGMNRSKGDVIDIFFINKELNKVKFINDVDGIMYPLKQIPDDKRFLKNFKWEDKRRPKNKLELFE